MGGAKWRLALAVILVLGAGAAIWRYASAALEKAAVTAAAERYCQAVQRKDWKTVYHCLPYDSTREVRGNEVIITSNSISEDEFIHRVDAGGIPSVGTSFVVRQYRVVDVNLRGSTEADVSVSYDIASTTLVHSYETDVFARGNLRYTGDIPITFVAQTESMPMAVRNGEWKLKNLNGPGGVGVFSVPPR
jgi:hypothetical protein